MTRAVHKYRVTLRRDVQQMAVVDVEAYSPQEAIDVAESVATETEAAWKIEEHIGGHAPKAALIPKRRRA